MNEKRGWGWFILALLTCPCHVVLIIPLLAGTAFATYFTEHIAATFIILGIIFALSLYMGWKRINQVKTNK